MKRESWCLTYQVRIFDLQRGNVLQILQEIIYVCIVYVGVCAPRNFPRQERHECVDRVYSHQRTELERSAKNKNLPLLCQGGGVPPPS